jgi:hypothetical protein
MPPRVVSSNAEAAAVPSNEPVTFRLRPEQMPDIPEPAGAADLPPPPASAIHPQADPSPPRAGGLSSQIENLRRSEQIANQRAARAEAYVRQAETYFQQQQLHGQFQQTWNELEAGVQTRNDELEAAKADYARCTSMNDYSGAAEAQTRMIDAQQKIFTIRAGQDELREVAEQEARRQQMRQQQQQAPQLNAQNIDSFIETQLPDLLPSEKARLKQHPDALLDAGNQQRLNIAFHDSVRDGLKRGTPEYFRHMDRRLGYESEDYSGGSSDPISMVLQGSAEPRRERRSTGRSVTLSKEERDMARLSGISEEEYGRQKLHLQDLKAKGYYAQE